MLRKLAYHDINRSEGCVDHDDSVDQHAAEVQSFCSLRAVTHRQDELCADEEHTDVAQEVEYVFAHVRSEGVDSRVSERSGDEVEGQVEVRKREEGEDQRQELIHELDV